MKKGEFTRGKIVEWTDKDQIKRKGIAYDYENVRANRPGTKAESLVIRPVDTDMNCLKNGDRKLITIKKMNELSVIGFVD